jgi:type IV pilus assembly protein PilB
VTPISASTKASGPRKSSGAGRGSTPPAPGTKRVGGKLQPAVTGRRLGDVLVDRGALSEAALAEALELRLRAPSHRRRLGQVVVDNHLAGERQVAEALGELFDIPVVDLSTEIIDPDEGRLLPKAIARRNGLLVMGRSPEGTLRVATADPKNVVALDDLRLHSGGSALELVIATESQVREQIEHVWSLTQDEAHQVSSDDIDDEPDSGTDADAVDEAQQAPIVRLVSSVLADAVRRGASDIHVEPLQRGLRIRLRLDGMLHEALTIPHSSRGAFVSRLKIIGGLDIAERRRPQDGRTRIDLGDVQVDARISTLPSLHGEKLVVRLLARAESTPRLDDMGLDERGLRAFHQTLRNPQGLILITGPTGSGKTSTLFSSLGEINDDSRNIVTLEDPVEIQLPGVTQVQINTKAGMTFAAGLRSVLRQDPDIVLVGEVRDTETAELALRASLTGHLVLTTVHTNDAVSALTRFVDMGIEPYLVASALSLVVAQRLVRTPCRNCVEPYTPSDEVLALLGLDPQHLDGATPKKGRGCRACSSTGYLGRRAVFEVVEVTPEMRRVLLADPTESALAGAARAAGAQTVRTHALDLARTGGTTYEEVLRVTDRGSGGRRCPGCDHAVSEDMVVCPLCTVALDAGHCTGCARTLEPDWRICPWCRTAASPGTATD